MVQESGVDIAGIGAADEHPDAEQQGPGRRRQPGQRRPPSAAAHRIPKQQQERDGEGQRQVRREHAAVGFGEQVLDDALLHHQPPVPVGDKKGEQVVGPEQRQPQLDFAGGPEHRFPVVFLEPAPAFHHVQDDEARAQRHLEPGKAVEHRENGVFPPRDHALGVVGADDEVDENQRHKVESAQQRQPRLLGVPLPLGAVPVARQHPVHHPAETRRRMPPLRHIRHRRKPQDKQGSNRQPDYPRQIPSVRRPDRPLEPDRPPDFQIMPLHRPRVADGRQDQHHRNERKDVEQPHHGEQFRHPRQRAPPVALGEPESHRRHRRRAGDHKHKGKGRHIVAPRGAVIEPVRRRPRHEPHHPQRQQRAATQQRQGENPRHRPHLGGHIARHCPRVGEDPHPGIMPAGMPPVSLIVGCAVMYMFAFAGCHRSFDSSA